MKKILSILSTISLSTITSTNIIACQQPNTNNNNQPTTPHFTPQQPPANSNWKLVNISWQQNINNFKNEFIKNNNKWYFFIESDMSSSNKFNNYLAKNDNNIKFVNGSVFVMKLYNNTYDYFDASKLRYIYCWQKNNEPTTPTIHPSTGKITEWNE